MLYYAGKLTLYLAEQLMPVNYGLKDASPYNVLFKGPTPVFIDFLSIERRYPGDYIWKPYSQFIYNFVLPLLVNKRFHLPLSDIFLANRNGIHPEFVYRILGLFGKLSPSCLPLVSIPTWLASGYKKEQNLYCCKLLDNHDKAQFILRRHLKYLRRKLDKVKPHRKRESTWSGYMDTAHDKNYSQTKSAIIADVMREFRPKAVLDIGCNTGHFSAIAAKGGAKVVAIDRDPAVVGEVWEKARRENDDILPIVVDFTRPSPSVGWRNQECPSFIQRARGNFDAVFMMAVIHHMMVSEGIPLSEILALAAEISSKLMVIEFIAPDDLMFRRLSRGRDHLFEYLTPSYFEAACRQHFDIIKSYSLSPKNRCIYLLQKKWS
jgi:SAM-dependent methyltransferase